MLELSSAALESDGGLTIFHNHWRDSFAICQLEKVVDLVSFLRQVNFGVRDLAFSVVHLGRAGKGAVGMGVDNDGGLAGLGHCRPPLDIDLGAALL